VRPTRKGFTGPGRRHRDGRRAVECCGEVGSIAWFVGAGTCITIGRIDSNAVNLTAPLRSCDSRAGVAGGAGVQEPGQAPALGGVPVRASTVPGLTHYDARYVSSA